MSASSPATPRKDPDAGISAIVITLNRWELLRESVKRICSFVPVIDELIVVDNGSSDGTPERVRQQFPWARLIALPRNVGIPQARNRGAEAASRECLLFLDDDGILEISPAALQRLVERLVGEPTLAAIAFPVVDAHSEPKRQDRMPDVLPRRLRLEPTYTFCGGAVLLKKSIFLAVGKYDEALFYSHEEEDLLFRLLSRGYALVRCPEARFLHFETARGPRRPRERMRRVYCYYRNRQRILWRHLPIPWALREGLAAAVGGILRTAFTRYLVACLAGTLSGWARAALDAVRGHRTPLPPDAYRRYRRLLAEEGRIPRRFRTLLSDLLQGRRLDWI